MGAHFCTRGHESLSILVRFAPNLLSVLDPASAFFISRNEMKTCLRPAQQHASKEVCLLKQNTDTNVSVFCFTAVLSPGIEPESPIPQTGILSIKL